MKTSYKIHEDGEPNFITIIKNDNWLLRIQFNGELSVNEQRRIANSIIVNDANRQLKADTQN